jgi:hypothetical protein
VLFTREQREGIARGVVTLTFRRWKRPQARVGGRYRLGHSGVVAIDSVDRVRPEALTDEAARQCGFADLAPLLAYLKPEEGDVFTRVAFHYESQPDVRAPLSAEAALSAVDLEEIARRLARLDAARGAPWTRRVLRLIAEHPGVRAADLAARLSRERNDFKVDVRKLKALGLTESLEVGYRLSPRGRAYLEAVAPPVTKA